MLNAAEPAPRQIAAALSGRAGLDAIHIIAHGAPGELRFAAGVLSANSVNEHAADLAALGAALGQNASLMLWTCETGQGERGQDFVAALASSSGRAGCRVQAPCRRCCTRRLLGTGHRLHRCAGACAADGGGGGGLRRGDGAGTAGNAENLDWLRDHG